MVKSDQSGEITQTPKAQRTRANLLASARQLIGTEGVNGVTVKAVCERANVGRTSFYNYFADVPTLLRTVADEVGRAVQAQFEAIHGQCPRGLERLERCLNMILELASHDAEFGLLLTSLVTRYPEIANLLHRQITLELTAAQETELPSLAKEACKAQVDFLTTATLAVARDLASGRLDTTLAETYATYLMRVVKPEP